jgi:hypothetical protein
MKKVLFLLLAIGSSLMIPISSYADENVTVTATSSDISENLDLKTVATLFGQAKDLEQFEQLLNNPDSAFSNLDLNGDGEVDYLRVIETADNDRHLVVVQAVLAKDIYQDVASIFVEKDEKTQSVTVQVIGDEYIYGVNYIIEPVYIHRPLIYDWFWGTSWVCWHSPYYWGYYPHWWRPYYCVDPFVYWDHCYWHHYHYPICSYRTGHHSHHHFRPMHNKVGRQDFAMRHPERSFATRNASRNITNARSIEQTRRESMRQANIINTSRTRVSAQSVNSRQSATGMRRDATMNRTFGSSNVRATSATTATRTATTTTAATRSATTSTATRSATTRTNTSAAAPVRSTNTTVRTSTTTSPSRSTAPSVSRSTTTPVRSSSATSSMRSSSSSTMRSSSAGGSMRSSSSTMRSSSGSSTMRSGSSGGSRTR